MEADFWIFSDFGLSAGVGHGASAMAIEDTGSHVLSPLYSPLIVPGERYRFLNNSVVSPQCSS